MEQGHHNAEAEHHKRESSQQRQQTQTKRTAAINRPIAVVIGHARWTVLSHGPDSD
jgi:hypothetical protein